MKKYSILICAYNVEKYIEECLLSALNQSYDKKKYEIIVVNDGSVDKTSEILNKYKKYIKIINQKNHGLPKARNEAFKNSSGEWIIYLDADDYISDNLLSEINKENLDKYNFIVFSEKKGLKANKIDSKVQKNKIDDSIAARAIKRELLENYKFPESYKHAIEDWDFYVKQFDKLVSLDISDKKDVYYYYRYNKDSLSKSKKIYRSRFQHAINLLSQPKAFNSNYRNKIIGHHYEHLYMACRLWFKELLPSLQKINFPRVNSSFSTKLQYCIVKIGIFNWFIKKSRIVVLD